MGFIVQAAAERDAPYLRATAACAELCAFGCWQHWAYIGSFDSGQRQNILVRRWDINVDSSDDISVNQHPAQVPNYLLIKESVVTFLAMLVACFMSSRQSLLITLVSSDANVRLPFVF